MTLLSTDTLVAMNRVLAETLVPDDHPDPIGFLKAKLVEAGFARQDIDSLRIVPLRAPSTPLHLPSPDLTAQQIIRMARRSLRPWRKILLAIMAKAEAIAEQHGGLRLAGVLEDEVQRKSILEDLGHVIAEVIDGMRLREIDTPEQAILCHLSARRRHNGWCLNWESMTDAKLARLDELVWQSPALSLLKSAKTPATMLLPLAS